MLLLTCVIVPALVALQCLAPSVTAAPTPPSSTLEASEFITSAKSKFGASIEGASVNKHGEVYATDFRDDLGGIGRVQGQRNFFIAPTEEKSYFNGVRFLSVPRQIRKEQRALAFAADVNNHRVVLMSQLRRPGGKLEVQAVTYCEDDTILQPNDLALAHKSGFVYMSGQKFEANTTIGDGDLWMCIAVPKEERVPGQPAAKATKLGSFGRTNGIEISPDEKTLYLSEAMNENSTPVVNRIWQFPINEDGTLGKKELFVDFEALDKTQATDVDGMRCDAAGNLYVTRNGLGEVVVFTPEGKVHQRIKTKIVNITNLEFGGTKGTSLFIVGRCPDDEKKGCVDVVRHMKTPGRAWSALNDLI